ncbi:uncharacterized protein [Apostichopus japonicus]|uniref:uncharacterized protein isoform X2 n=1 Tax=Stichopus japonicus TaxID=307972 RepID=UPI003AB3AA36
MSYDNGAPKGRRGRSKGRGAEALPNNWKDKKWVQSFAKDEPSPLGDLMDMSPAFALRKVLLLIEKQKYQDASQVINQMGQDTLSAIITDMPIASLILKIPSSLILLESIYSKLFLLKMDNFPREKMGVEGMVFQIVKYLSTTDTSGGKSGRKESEIYKSVTNILRIVLFVDPEIVKVLQGRVDLMESAMEGIGEHGMVKLGESVLNMHDALKQELDRTIVSYKTAIQKLDQLSLAHNKPITLTVLVNKRSSFNNHQMLMRFTQDAIQERLFKNKTILNTIESSLNPHLPYLISNLKQRVEYDKHALLAFGRLRREIPTISPDAKVAPIVSQYLKSLKSVLDILQSLLKEEYPEHLVVHRKVVAAERDSAVLDLDDVFHVAGHDGDGDTSGLGDSETQEDSSSNGTRYKEVPVDVPTDPIPIPPPLHITSPLRGRSRSADRWRSRRKGKKQSRADRLRSLSADRGVLLISRPEQKEVESNPEFQVMMKRISTVSSSSPGYGSSLCIAILRRHSTHVNEKQPSSERPTTASSNVSPEDSTWGRAESRYSLRESTSYSDSRPSSGYSEQYNASLTNELAQERSLREAAEADRDKYQERQKVTQSELDRTKRELRELKEQLGKLKEEGSRPTNNKPSSKVDSVRDTLMKFDKLYTTQRHQVWSSLSDSSESLRELEDKEELKDKLLFSVVVLSFRAAKETLAKIRHSVGTMLNLSGMVNSNGMNDLNKSTSADKTEKELYVFLQNLGDKFDMMPMVQEVRMKLNNALRNYSAWSSSPSLDDYISRCVLLAWKLTILQPPLEAHYDMSSFNPHFHRRSPGSNPNSTDIKVYLWPSLIESDSTRCVYRGIVST